MGIKRSEKMHPITSDVFVHLPRSVSVLMWSSLIGCWCIWVIRSWSHWLISSSCGSAQAATCSSESPAFTSQVRETMPCNLTVNGHGFFIFYFHKWYCNLVFWLVTKQCDKINKHLLSQTCTARTYSYAN